MDSIDSVNEPHLPLATPLENYALYNITDEQITRNNIPLTGCRGSDTQGDSQWLRIQLSNVT